MDRRTFAKTLTGTALATVTPNFLSSTQAAFAKSPQPDHLLIELGYRWLSPTELLEPILRSIASVRQDFWHGSNFLLPTCRVRDNLDLEPFAYRISQNGKLLQFGYKQPATFLFVNPDRDQVSNFPAHEFFDDLGYQLFWVPNDQFESAKAAGLNHIDYGTFLAVQAGVGCYRRQRDTERSSV